MSLRLNQKNILTIISSIFLVALLLLAIIFTIYRNINEDQELSYASSGRLAEVILHVLPLPKSKQEPIEVLFKYGDSKSDFNVVDSLISLNINTDKFEIVPGSAQDWYNPDFENDIVCTTNSNSYSGPKYSISSAYYDQRILTYSPQTANDNSQGSNLPKTLKSGANGCIRILVKPIENVNKGEITSILFDEDAFNSKSFTELMRPPLQTQKIEVI